MFVVESGRVSRVDSGAGCGVAQRLYRHGFRQAQRRRPQRRRFLRREDVLRGLARRQKRSQGPRLESTHVSTATKQLRPGDLLAGGQFPGFVSAGQLDHETDEFIQLCADLAAAALGADGDDLDLGVEGRASSTSSLPFVGRCLPCRDANRGAGTSHPHRHLVPGGWPALFRMARATRRSPVATTSVHRICHQTAA